MSVIIRLQNLPWSANAADIRQYFRGLSIPEGGVHIVGGEKGDAFISFSTDEDARQAMLSDGGCIKDIQIRLLLSSRNEMQKVIETARQQSIQITQVYMQQMQQPQLPLVGSLPPLTAKVLPQPQQQPPRPNQLVAMLQRHHPIMDAATVLMSQEKQQQQLQQQQQQSQHQHMSPKPAEIKDRDDKPGGYKRERTRSKSREHRSKSSRSSGGSNRRDRSKSRDRRRRDRSRGRDRSRDRYRNDGRNRNSSSRGSGGKSHRSRSPVTKAADGAGKGMIADQQQQQQQPPSARTWNGQYNNNVLQQHQAMADNHQPPVMNAGPHGNVGTMFNQFRTPPQPPIVPVLAPNPYQQQHQPVNNEWGAGNDGRQQPYAPDNNFRGESYGGGSDDEDDRQAEFDNNYHRRFNDNSNNAAARRGRPGQDFHDQQGFNGPNRNPRFNKPPQQSMVGGQQHNRGGGHHRQFDGFGGAGGGPRFNHHQQHPRYGGANSSGPNVADSNNIGGGGRPSRFSSIQDGVGGGKPSRFNPVPQQQQQQHRGRDEDGAGDGDGSDFNDPKRPATGTPRFNDRYRYDVRNSQTGPRAEGLCVEVNNMTSHFSYGDVRKVFEGIHIDGSAIKIQKHRQGVAFVRFDSNYNKNLAMRVNGNAYKGNNVVVKHLDDEAYERENTDDRPYPAAVATPNVVDLVDLVDDEDDNEGAKDGTKHSDDDSNKLVVCEKNASAAEGGSDGGEAQQSSSVTSQQPQQSQQQQPSQQPQQQQNVSTKYLKLKQLPITVTEDDVLNEMDGGGEVRRVTFYPDGEFMGALLEFRSVDEAEATLKRFDCVLLGSTPVPVLRCTYKEYVQIKRKTGGGTRRFSGENTGGSVVGGGGCGGGGGGGVGGGRHYNQHHNPVSAQPNAGPTGGNRSNCLYVHGLPTSVTNTDITQFFADSTALPDKIHIMLSKFGRPTGESYCEFSSPQQAHAALVKDQCYMGPNLVYVVPINRSDMIQAITKPMQQHHQDMSWGPGGGAGGNRGGGGGGPRQHNMMSGPRQQHQGPQSSYGGGRGGGYGGGGRPQPYMNNARGGGGGYTPRMRGPGPNSGPNTGPDGFGQPGCVVALDNVPYRAEVQEIVDFFEGFDLNSQNVIRRFNDFGKPTGEARVNLRNPQEAMRAVRVLQNKPIYNRPVCLTLL